MFARLTKQPDTSISRLILWGALVIGFLAIGIALGTAANGLFDRATSTSAAHDTAQPAAGAKVDPPYQVKDFTLISQTGAPISLSDLRGKAVMMFFGYTHCPDVCPTTMADYTRVKAALGDQAGKVAFVFISVDGVRDTPDVVGTFLNQFDNDFIGMTGDEATLRQIGSEYGLLFQTDTITGDPGHEQDGGQNLDGQNYFVQHTSPSFLIDPDGYLRMVFFYGTKQAAMVEGIRQVFG